MNRYLLIALAACAVVILFGWQHIERQADQLATAQGQVNTLTKAAESRRNTQKLLATLDTEHTKALNDAQATNNQLRAAVASGAHRLSIKAACPAVRATAGAARVDDAETRADIDPAAAERVVAITNDGDEAIRALNGLQDYVNRVCLKGN
ncbi:lysis system i-spanin subunit Rz [Pseudomonas mandelii]|uniref:Lysis protein n=1 Tax=Pseudomonas mandelii TaxID=75612 RepID=A0AB36CQN2_9PSED|nr:lysis system i-spanin subunit Rz [Pseudomonas mandelii]NMZ78414.1 lysis protein [Pseudomonas mandelii]